MKNEKSLVYKLALFISTVGNPLVTVSVFIVFVSAALFTPAQAAWLSFLVVGCVAIPVAANNYFKTKKGHYTNFDLSDRKQRQNVYPRLLFLMAVITVILFATHQPVSFCIGSAVILAMMTASYVVNFWLKASMHTSISFFLAFGLFKLSLTGGVLMLAFAVLISVSRLVLKRHTIAEVLAGGLLGTAFGLLNYFL